jgi:hypothetical protein
LARVSLCSLLNELIVAEAKEEEEATHDGGSVHS